jgi:hypothetical protein
MDFLMKNKKTYLMIGGTFFPAFVGYSIAGSLGFSQNVKNVVAIAGFIAGGIITSKMLK